MESFKFDVETIQSVLSLIFIYLGYLLTMTFILVNHIMTFDIERVKRFVFVVMGFACTSLLLLDRSIGDHQVYSFLSFIILLNILVFNQSISSYTHRLNILLVLFLIPLRILMFISEDPFLLFMTTGKYIFLLLLIIVLGRETLKVVTAKVLFFSLSYSYLLFEVLLFTKFRDSLIPLMAVVIALIIGVITYVYQRFITRFKIYFEQSHKDFLTDLYNDRALSDCLESVLKRRKKTHSFVFIDLNGLKQVNDLYGHRYGDLFLTIASTVLKEIYTPYGYIFRKSGDEFVVIVHGEVDEAKQYSEAFVKSLSNERMKTSEGEVKLSVSIGIVPITPTSTEAEVLQRADEAMYNAKENGQAIALG